MTDGIKGLKGQYMKNMVSNYELSSQKVDGYCDSQDPVWPIHNPELCAIGNRKGSH